MKWWNKKIFFLLAVLFLNGLFFYSAKAATENKNINVQLVIPGSGGSGSTPPIVSDTTPPTISSVASSTTFTTASVTWNASDNKGISSVTFDYGTTLAYGLTAAPGGSYVVSLSGLTTNTVYFFKITVVDTSNNSSNFTGSFKTAVYISPTLNPVISNVIVTPGVNSAIVTFDTDKNTTVQINYGETMSLGSNASEGQTPAISHVVTLLGLSPNKTHYYQIIATDVNLNSTSTTILNFKTLADTTSPPDVSNLQISIVQNSFTLTWKNPSSFFAPDFVGVKILRKIGIHASGPNDNGATVVYSGNGETTNDNLVLAGFNYFYTVFSYDTSNNFSSGNFVQGKIDSAIVVNPPNEPPTPVVIAPILVGGSIPVCNDGKDNDNDGLVDFPVDPGCVSLQDNDEYNSPVATVPEFEKLSLDKLKFFAGSHQIELSIKNKTISGLAGSNLSVGIKKTSLIGEPKSLILRVGDTDQHQFSLDNSNNTYYADILFPQSGKSQAYIEINYGADQFDSLGVDLQAIDLGQITDGQNKSLVGVEVTLHKENGDIFPAQIYGQKNPQITSGNSLVGWMVPNGRFYITAKKDKFYEYSGQFFTTDNNIVNTSISLVAIPPKIQDVIDPNASIAKNAINVAKNIAEKTAAVTAIATKQLENAIVVVQEIAADPVVKQIANTVVAPTAVGVAAVGTVALVSWADILPLLRFLFLQPLLLLGRGKREKWGTVYNSLSKLPVDLALVRLFNLDTGKLVQTKVTSSDGRYFFSTNAGRYRLEVKKGTFIFPTSLLKGFQTDGQRIDIYHGEEIRVSAKGSIITANIPLDPAGQKLKTPLRLIVNKMMRRVQGAVSWIGLLITLGSLYISPVWYMWVLLGIHLSMTFAFKRLAKPPVAKGWGIIYDDQTKKPLSRVVARLFDSKFNKLVATEITGPDGKYYFMAGDNQYYVAYDRDGYESLKTEIIDLKGKEAETIAKDVNLKKK